MGPLSAIPADVLEFFEYAEGHHEAEVPYVATWLVEQVPHFAALHWAGGHPWLVQGLLVPGQYGVLQLGKFSIESWKHNFEVTPATVNSVPVGEIRDLAIISLRSDGDEPKQKISYDGKTSEIRIFSDEETAARERLLKQAIVPEKRGRRGYGHLHWARVSLGFINVCRDHLRGDVYVTLGEYLGTDPATAKRWVKEARKRGYLMPGRPGRLVAELGPQMQVLIRRG